MSNKVQIGLGLMAWATGASKQLMNVLHHASLSMSYPSIMSIINALANDSLQQAQRLTDGPHGLGYDNVNTSMSQYIEQGPDMKSKVQSGVYMLVYHLLQANPAHMKIKDTMDRLTKSSNLTISDLRPSIKSISSYSTQSTVNICQILLKYVKGFEFMQKDKLLQHMPIRMIPEGHKTRFHALRASTIEEASVEGNLLVHDDIYINQLKKDPANLNKFAIPCMNDQLTNARIRGAQDIRRQDVSYWERRDILQLAFGAFHLVMNLIWALVNTHRGTINQSGSLTHLFAILEKTRLAGEKPDYHTLLASLTQVLEGLILNAWRMECGHNSLDDFAHSKPSAQDLLSIAQDIMMKYATPKCNGQLNGYDPDVSLRDIPTDPSDNDPQDGDSDTEMASEEGPGTPDSGSVESDSADTEDAPDTIHENVVLLTRDLLYVIELVNAISTGDFGRVEDILPTLACLFRGAGSNNYSTEILHLLFNLKEVWTPEFA